MSPTDSHNRQRVGTRRFALLVLLALFWGNAARLAGEDRVDLRKSSDRIDVVYENRVIAEYRFQDDKVSHPYWSRICSLSGLQLTRNHPPVEGSDAIDHVGMHTGAWLAFGDVSGNDYWRLKSPVKQVAIRELPVEESGAVSFEVQNEWWTSDSKKLLLAETTRFRIRLVEQGYLIEWDVVLAGRENEVVFGEQEEMGLGLRVATPLAVDKNLGGRILDSEQRRNGKAIWGNTVEWCDYSGPMHDSNQVQGQEKWAGITILNDAKNGRVCRCHARDYGFVALNPFSTRVFTGGEPTPFRLEAGTSVRLRFGLYVHESKSEKEFSVLPAKNIFDLATP